MHHKAGHKDVLSSRIAAGEVAAAPAGAGYGNNMGSAPPAPPDLVSAQQVGVARWGQEDAMPRFASEMCFCACVLLGCVVEHK